MCLNFPEQGFFKRKVLLKAVYARSEKLDLLVLARFRLAVLSELLSTADGLRFPALAAAAHARELVHEH
jgi:hypothetical protein